MPTCQDYQCQRTDIVTTCDACQEGLCPEHKLRINIMPTQWVSETENRYGTVITDNDFQIVEVTNYDMQYSPERAEAERKVGGSSLGTNFRGMAVCARCFEDFTGESPMDGLLTEFDVEMRIDSVAGLGKQLWKGFFGGNR